MYINYMQKRCSNCGLSNMTNCNTTDISNDMETACSYVQSLADINSNECDCGFDEGNSIFPDNPVLGQSYVPWQNMDRTFTPEVGLKMGTIFPELVSPYMPGQSAAEIDYIAANNSIREGCNKC